MSQDAFGRVGFFEDFLSMPDDNGLTIVDADGVAINDYRVIAQAGDATMDTVVTKSGGIASFVGDGAADGGVVLTSSPMAPSVNGPIRMGVRFEIDDLTTLQLFIGFQETVDRDEAVIPFTLDTGTLTSNSAGQVFGLYYDTTATTDDWRMHGASDSTEFTAALGALGTRAYSTPVAAEFMVARIEIDPDGTARAYYGDSSTDPHGTGMNLVGTLAAGNLDEDAFYHPVVFLIDPSSTGPVFSVDYFWARGNRDWTV